MIRWILAHRWRFAFFALLALPIVLALAAGAYVLGSDTWPAMEVFER